MFEDIPAAGSRDHASIDITTPMMLDFLEWLALRPRPYAEAMEIWRTSCPRLTIWEDAADAGYVVRTRIGSAEALVELTPPGLRRLQRSRRTTSEA
jgi:hypothetical protein